MATPITIRDMFASVRRSGGAMLKAQVTSKVATAFEAWDMVSDEFPNRNVLDSLSAFV